MKFEHDPKKSKLNKEKHGIFLEEAEQLWLLVGIEIEARTVDEPRIMRIGKLNGKLYSCVYTLRGESNIRLISARRSRKEEEELYNEYTKAQ